MKSPKSTKVVIRQRVEELLSLRLLGAEFPDLRKHADTAGWQISNRQLWRYIGQGDKYLAESLEKDREKLVNRHLAQRRALYARAMSVSDYGTALRILQDEAELLQLYPAKRAEIIGDGSRQALIVQIVETAPNAQAVIDAGAKTAIPQADPTPAITDDDHLDDELDDGPLSPPQQRTTIPQLHRQAEAGFRINGKPATMTAGTTRVE